MEDVWELYLVRATLPALVNMSNMAKKKLPPFVTYRHQEYSHKNIMCLWILEQQIVKQLIICFVDITINLTKLVYIVDLFTQHIGNGYHIQLTCSEKSTLD